MEKCKKHIFQPNYTSRWQVWLFHSVSSSKFFKQTKNHNKYGINYDIIIVPEGEILTNIYYYIYLLFIIILLQINLVD